jgi:hypothetical protein
VHVLSSSQRGNSPLAHKKGKLGPACILQGLGKKSAAEENERGMLVEKHVELDMQRQVNPEDHRHSLCAIKVIHDYLPGDI